MGGGADDSALAALVEHSKGRLDFLNVPGSNLTDEAVASAAELCGGNLRNVDLSNCFK